MVSKSIEQWAAEQICPRCQHVGLEIDFRLEAKPIGTFSLAGNQPKISARKHPYLICPECKITARGEMTNGT